MEMGSQVASTFLFFNQFSQTSKLTAYVNRINGGGQSTRLCKSALTQTFR